VRIRRSRRTCRGLSSCRSSLARIPTMRSLDEQKAVGYPLNGRLTTARRPLGRQHLWSAVVRSARPSVQETRGLRARAQSTDASLPSRRIMLVRPRFSIWALRDDFRVEPGLHQMDDCGSVRPRG
jgi:hypothetical protein